MNIQHLFLKCIALKKTVLTYLQFTGQSVPDKRSFVDTYKFPNQECELRPGNKVKIGDEKTLMEINEINEQKRIKEED